MANPEQYSRSVLGDTDEVPDIYCEPCQQAGRVAIAEGYCVDCPEYLCGPCNNSHQLHTVFANHVLLDKDSMPLSTDSCRRILDVCEEKCPIHPSEAIELFCETCDKFVCNICVTNDHHQCKEVKHIRNIVKELEYDEEFEKFTEDIKSTDDELSKQEEKLQANDISNEDMWTLAKHELKRHRAEDQLKKNVDDQITAIKQRNQDTLKAASDRLDHMKTDFDQIKNDMEAKNAGQRCGLFIAIKQSKEKMKTFQDQFIQTRVELEIQHYTLVPSEQMQTMMRTTTEICRIATARLESEIDINTSTDTKGPSIFDLRILHGRYCIALDNAKRSIMAFDTKSKCLTSEITIEAEDILSMTSVSDDKVAVSVSSSDFRNQMQFFTVSSSGIIQPTCQMYVENCYYGMVHCAGNIYGIKLKRIDQLSMTGTTIRTIHTDDTGIMAGIAGSPDGQTLYVTNGENHSIASMTLDGKVKAIYKDKDLESPVGIAVDKHGYVYASSYGTDNIQQFTADLDKVQNLIDVYSNTIGYSSTENKLYIHVSNQIHQYSLDSYNRQAPTTENKYTKV